MRWVCSDHTYFLTMMNNTTLLGGISGHTPAYPDVFHIVMFQTKIIYLVNYIYLEVPGDMLTVHPLLQLILRRNCFSNVKKCLLVQFFFKKHAVIDAFQHITE